MGGGLEGLDRKNRRCSVVLAGQRAWVDEGWVKTVQQFKFHASSQTPPGLPPSSIATHPTSRPYGGFFSGNLHFDSIIHSFIVSGFCRFGLFPIWDHTDSSLSTSIYSSGKV